MCAFRHTGRDGLDAASGTTRALRLGGRSRRVLAENRDACCHRGCAPLCRACYRYVSTAMPQWARELEPASHRLTRARALLPAHSGPHCAAPTFPPCCSPFRAIRTSPLRTRSARLPQGGHVQIARLGQVLGHAAVGLCVSAAWLPCAQGGEGHGDGVLLARACSSGPVCERSMAAMRAGRGGCRAMVSYKRVHAAVGD